MVPDMKSRHQNPFFQSDPGLSNEGQAWMCRRLLQFRRVRPPWLYGCTVGGKSFSMDSNSRVPFFGLELRGTAALSKSITQFLHLISRSSADGSRIETALQSGPATSTSLFPTGDRRVPGALQHVRRTECEPVAARRQCSPACSLIPREPISRSKLRDEATVRPQSIFSKSMSASGFPSLSRLLLIARRATRDVRLGGVIDGDSSQNTI